MKWDRRMWVRIIAIVLAVLLAGTAVVSAVISIACAEEVPPANRMTLTMEYSEEAQALRVSQRLVYINGSERALDRLLFYLPANLLRRLDSLPYEGDELAEALPLGYLPGGVELTDVRVNGVRADYGFQGEDELYLRVACELAPGASAEFEFDYYLLLTENAAFLGVSETGARLSGFYFAPASLDARGEFILNPPLSFTPYADTPRMDVEAAITLPENYTLAATGEERLTLAPAIIVGTETSAEPAIPNEFAVYGEAGDESSNPVDEAAHGGLGVDDAEGSEPGLPVDAVARDELSEAGALGDASGGSGAWPLRRWTVTASNVRGFAMAFGKRYREYAATPQGGVRLRCLTNLRGVGDELLSVAAEAVADCEAWFGPFPCGQLDFAQADIAGGSLAGAGCLWLSAEMLRDKDARDHAVRAFVARQYFGERTGAHPVSDAWLSDSVCEYLAYLLLEEAEGHDAYLAALNANIVPSLQLTLPGGLNVTSDASLFTAQEYQIVVRDRGAAVFHELRIAMGRDELLSGLRGFYERGLSVDFLGEMDLLAALNEATGRDWEAFLTDYLFHIGDYVNQTIDWLD